MDFHQQIVLPLMTNDQIRSGNLPENSAKTSLNYGSVQSFNTSNARKELANSKIQFTVFVRTNTINRLETKVERVRHQGYLILKSITRTQMSSNQPKSLN